jgi:hypothetical protein
MDRSLILSIISLVVCSFAVGFLVCFVWLVYYENIERRKRVPKLTLKDRLANRDTYIKDLEMQLKSAQCDLADFKAQHQGGGCGVAMNHKTPIDDMPTYRHLYEHHDG